MGTNKRLKEILLGSGIAFISGLFGYLFMFLGNSLYKPEGDAHTLLIFSQSS